MDDSDHDNRNKEKELARQLLSEEELRYFSGNKKKNKLKRLLLNKRKNPNSIPKESLDHDSVNTITKTVASVKEQQEDTKLSSNKNSALLVKKGRGLPIIVASSILVFLVVALVVVFTLKTGGNPTTKDLSFADSESLADSAVDKRTLSTETATDPSDSAIRNNTSNVPATSANSQTESLTVAKSNNNESTKSNDQLVAKQTLENNKQNAKEQSTEQNDKKATVSYEDFAKEAQTTIYRDSDY